MATTVPMLAPDGTSGDIPQDKVQDAIKAGFKQAVEMTSPDGKAGYIPMERQQDALTAGFKLAGQPQQQHSVLDPKGGWSVGDLARGAVSAVKNAVAHPLDTAAGMAQPFLASGMAPGGMYPTTAATTRPEDSQANAQVQQAAQQGQADSAKFVGKNPAYAVGGVVGPALLTAGVAKFAPRIAGVAVEGAGRAALLGKTAEGAYESALKPSTTLSQAQRANIVQTGLENEIPVSKQGLADIGNLIDKYNQQIKDTIAADPTRPISPVPALQNLKAVRAKFQTQVNPAADVGAVNSAGNEFASQFQPDGTYPQGTMPAADAQAMKQGTYRALGDKSFGELKGASIEAQKALARGLKDEIANQFPEINSLNASESRLLDLQPVLERAINRNSNHQLIGIGSPVAGVAAKAVTGSGTAGVVASTMKAVLDNPVVKSRLAIAVSKAQKIPFSQASAKVQAYSASLGAFAGTTQAALGDQSAEQ